MNAPLILTACIDTGETPFVCLTDRKIRMVQYAVALLFWLEETRVSRIVFAEGSATAWPRETIASLAASLGKEIVWLDLDVMQESVRYGKGRGEWRLIDGALAAATHRGWLDPHSDSFYKATGRLIVRNFDAVESAVGGAQRAFTLDSLRHQADTRFFKCDAAAWRHWFAPEMAEIDDRAGYWIEHAVYQGLADYRKQIAQLPDPDIAGESATSGRMYGPVESARIARAARVLEGWGINVSSEAMTHPLLRSACP